ncbi:MAG: recombinase RecT [Bacteroidales bacterium]
MENNTQIATREKESKLLVFAAQKQFEVSNEYKMNFNREAGFAIQILTNNPYLMKCDPDSVKHAVVNVALTGITLNPALKYAYLVPRKVKSELKCILDISYMGMIKILTDAGAVKNVDAGVIYQNDRYDFRRGSDPYFKHVPALSGRGEKIGAYAIAFLRDGGFQFEIMGREDIEKVRATSESYKNEEGRKYSPWETWEDEMWKKTVLKRLFKLLPKTNFSDQLIAAISHDYEAEMSDVSAPKEDKYSGIFEDIQEATVVNDPPAPKTKAAKQTEGQPEIFNDPQK